MLRTALIVAVPEAEPAVGRLRATLDRAAAWGVPAHVTVLYPFLPPDRITGAVTAAVRAAVATVARFEVTFRRTDSFGTDVLWLAPEPDTGFRALTAAVWHRFPDTPPYEGAHDDVVPHLTIAEGQPVTVLRDAQDTVAAHLPFAATVDRVRLIAGSAAPDSWRTLDEFPLRRSLRCAPRGIRTALS
jgi:2'-5' RNA ligase